MHVVYERCAGLDVHKRTVVACATTPNADGQPQKERQTFSTMTVEICQMRDWLKGLGVTHVAMESTGVFSPVLANMTLDGLERRVRARFPKTTGKGIAAKVNFVRYADDFIVTAASKELLEQEVKPLVEAFMKERGLELSSEKTCITHIEDGFDFLGQMYASTKRESSTNCSSNQRKRMCMLIWKSCGRSSRRTTHCLRED